MKVTSIKTALLQANFEWLFIKIETDEGIIGLGEDHWGFGVNEAIHRLESHLIGEDPRNINHLWDKMYRIVAGAAAHLCAVVPNFLILEFHAEDILWFNNLVKGEVPIIDRGYLTLPDKPSLGLELDEEGARQHLKQGEKLVE